MQLLGLHYHGTFLHTAIYLKLMAVWAPVPSVHYLVTAAVTVNQVRLGLSISAFLLHVSAENILPVDITCACIFTGVVSSVNTT